MQLDLDVQIKTDQFSLASIPWEAWLQQWLIQLNPCDPEDSLPLHLDHAYELCLRLTDDDEIRSLNHQFRDKNQPTDVLAFAALEVDTPLLEDEDEPLYLGDIVVSVETASRQATEQCHSLEVELAWLVSHGLLHLLGWDHPDDQRLAEMLEQQRGLLQGSGIIA